MRNYRRAPDCALALVLKGIAGLLIIAGLVVIGVQTELERDVAAGQPHDQRSDGTSVAESPRIHEERQLRFTSTQGIPLNSVQTAPLEKGIAAGPSQIEVRAGPAPSRRD